MCMKATEEGCVLKEQLKEVQATTTNLNTRLTQVEHDMAKMRSESQDGFKQGAEAMRAINTSVSNLAHDFGQRMNNIDKRLVEEKEKWGTTLRSIVIWTVRLVLMGCAVAMGVATYKQIFTGGS